jgi:tripartite-type tricarboxylate transporter receptor subunit TctC
MNFPRRRFLHLIAGAAAAPALSRTSLAQGYPARPVRWLVGFAPGGSSDIHARLIARLLAERLGQQFVVENRPGAGSNLAVQAAVNAPPDGYTLVTLTSSNASNATLYHSLPFDLQRDLVPVAAVSRGALVLAVNPSVPVRTIAEFIAYAKANAGKINLASYGVGTTSHLAGELFKAMAGIALVHVPYRGDALALTDTIAGQVQATFSTVIGSFEFVRTGKLRALGVTTTSRWETLPDVPTIAEVVPGYEAIVWNGVAAPRGTPQDIIETLNREINAGLTSPEMKERMIGLGSVPMPMSPAEFNRLLIDDTARWAKVIRAANIKPE